MVSFKAPATHGAVQLLAKPFGDFGVDVVSKDSDPSSIENKTRGDATTEGLSEARYSIAKAQGRPCRTERPWKRG
jgi:hypothetical protein